MKLTSLLLHISADIISQMASLVGSMSLVTMADSDTHLLSIDSHIVPTLDIATSLDRAISIGRCFTLFCSSAATHHSKFQRIVARNRRKRRTKATNVETDEEQKLFDRILTDLKGARVIARFNFYK